MDFEKISKSLILALIFLLPLTFFPYFQNVLDFPKQFLLFFLLSLSFLFLFLKILSQGKIKIFLHPFHFILISFLFFSFLSLLFSLSKIQSLYGIPLAISQSFLTLFYLCLFYFLFILLFKREEIFLPKILFSLSIFLLLVFSFFQIFGKFLLPFDFSKTKIFNLSGSQYSFSILLASLVPFFYLSFLNSRKPIKFFFFILFFLSLVFLSLLNFKLSFLILFFGSLFLVSVLPLQTKISPKELFFPVFLIFISLIFLSFPFQILPLNLPFEISLSQKTSFEIALASIKERPIFGTGPATFSFVFSKHKPQFLNETIFWNQRFSNSASNFFDTLSTLGILGTISFLLVLIFPIWLGILKRKSPEFLASLFSLSLAKFFYPFNLTLEFSFFLFLGFLFSQILEREKEIDFSKGKISLFAFSFSSVFILSLLLFNLFFSFKNLVSEFFYFKGLKSWQEQNLDKAINYLEKSRQLNSLFDFYLRDLSQVYLAKAFSKLQQGEQDIQNEVFLAINFAKEATEREKFNVANFSVRAFVYQSLIGIAQGAEDWAIKMWQQALNLEPKNPFYFTQIAQALAQKGQLEQAQENLQIALKLKPDFAPAHFQEALIWQQKGELERAISKLEETKNLAPFDVGLAFQLGLLYYQKGDFERAKTELERATTLSPDYANALYFLGLSYQKLGQKEKALERLKRVSELNPDVEFVKKIIKNIEEGKDPFEGVFQPSPPIQERLPEIKK